MKTLLLMLVPVLLLSGVALGQTPVHADQGKPGNQGPWPVTFSGGIIVVGPDGGAVPVQGTVTANQGLSRDGGTDWPVLAKQNGAWNVGFAFDGGPVTANQGLSRDGGTDWPVTAKLTDKNGVSYSGTYPFPIGFDGGPVTAYQGGAWVVDIRLDGGPITANQGLSRDGGTDWPVTAKLTDSNGSNFSGAYPFPIGFDGGPVTAYQGGSWSVSIDGGSVTAVSAICSATALDGGLIHQLTVVGTGAANVPANNHATRLYVEVCNSLQNTGSPILKCRADNTAPVAASGNAGDVLGIGDCIRYSIAASNALQCISDAAGTNATSYECIP